MQFYASVHRVFSDIFQLLHGFWNRNAFRLGELVDIIRWKKTYVSTVPAWHRDSYVIPFRKSENTRITRKTLQFMLAIRTETEAVGVEDPLGDNTLKETPAVVLDHLVHDCVVDLRSLCSIPFDNAEDAVRTFRLLRFPKGKALHVPEKAGHYIVHGDYLSQWALSIVHFAEATARKPELCLSFYDYGVLGTTACGIYVESLALPLLKRKNVYSDTPRMTKISDVVGFSPIDFNSIPWSVHLKPALSKQLVFANLKLFSLQDVKANCRLLLDKRIEKLLVFTKEAMVKEVNASCGRDQRLINKRLAIYEATLAKTEKLLASLPPTSYDYSLEKRVIKIGIDSEKPDWLSTPIRAKLVDGSAGLARTELRKSPRHAHTSAAGPADELMVQVQAPEQINKDGSEGSELEELLSDDGKEDEPTTKRKRTATVLFDIPAQGKLKKDKKKGEKPAAIDMGINPRGNKPYKRGPYAKKDNANSAAAQIRRAAAREVAASEKGVKANAEVSILKAELGACKSKITMLEKQLEDAKTSTALQIKNAEMALMMAHRVELLHEYKKGIQDGSGIMTGGPRYATESPFPSSARDTPLGSSSSRN